MVKNALKFTLRGKIEIRVWYDSAKQNLIVHVEDSGIGIEAEDLTKLFTQFGRLQRTTEMNHDGIGLGLTIVKQLVKAYGGNIKVESEGQGKGSLFIFDMEMKQAVR